MLGRLSRGTALDVYDLWSEERDCRCIGKTPRPDRRDSDAHRMLLAEGRLLQRLTHPHIVRCYEVITAPRPIVILETLSGATLSHLIDVGTRLAPDDLAILGLQLCSAVGYLHRRAGVLHLDLKPSNVVVESGHAKLIDLSIARRPCRGHGGVGSTPYISPERELGAMVSEATDVWGIGMVLFEAATGQRPFDRRDGDGHAPLARPARSVRGFRPLPRALAGAIDACLECEPDRRPRVASLAAALASFAPVV